MKPFSAFEAAGYTVCFAFLVTCAEHATKTGEIKFVKFFNFPSLAKRFLYSIVIMKELLVLYEVAGLG